MDTVDRIKSICKERKIAISRLERECGFSNAYISQLRKGTLPADRLLAISEFLGVSMYYLMTGKDDRSDYPVFKDVHIELITLFGKLTKEQQNAYIDMLRSTAPNN